MKPEEKVVFPLAKSAAPTEETQAIDASDLVATDDDRAEWRCKSCGEENQGILMSVGSAWRPVDPSLGQARLFERPMPPHLGIPLKQGQGSDAGS